MQKTAIAVAAIFLLIAGFSAVRTFGNETPPPPPPPSPTPTGEGGLPEIPGPPPPTVPYNTVGDMKEAMDRAGLTCTGFSILEQNDPAVTGFALCDVGTADNRFNIYIFKNTKTRDAWIGSIVQSGLPWVFGPNWIVVSAGDPNTAAHRADLLQRAIGGQVADVEF